MSDPAPERFAPFCGNPDCVCAVADAEPCDEYKDDTDTAGVHRCAECGRPEGDHR